MAHTPAPWTIGGTRWLQDGKLYEEYPNNERGADYYVSVETDDEYVAIVGGTDPDANARLIKAAPKMLAFIKQFLTSVDYDRDEHEARALVAEIEEAR